MLAAYADTTVEVDRHIARLYDLSHLPRHQAGKWVACHLQGAAGRKTSAVGRRRGTLSPRAAGPPSRGPRSKEGPRRPPSRAVKPPSGGTLCEGPPLFFSAATFGSRRAFNAHAPL